MRVFETGQALRDRVLRVAHRDGRTSWLQVTVQPLFAESDAPYAAVASLIEVTAQRHAREQLERHTRFRAQLGGLVEASLQDDLGSTFYQRLMEGAVNAIPGAQAGSLLLRGDDGPFYFAAAVNFDQAVLARTYLHEHELYRDPDIVGPQLIYGFDNSGILEPERRARAYGLFRSPDRPPESHPAERPAQAGSFAKLPRGYPGGPHLFGSGQLQKRQRHLRS